MDRLAICLCFFFCFNSYTSSQGITTTPTNTTATTTPRTTTEATAVFIMTMQTTTVAPIVGSSEVISYAPITTVNSETSQNQTDSAGCLPFGKICGATGNCQCCSVGRWSHTVMPTEQCACTTTHFMCATDNECCSMNCAKNCGNQCVDGFCELGMAGDLCNKNDPPNCPDGSTCVDTTGPARNVTNRAFGYKYSECQAVAKNSATTSTNVAVTTETFTTSTAISSAPTLTAGLKTTETLDSSTTGASGLSEKLISSSIYDSTSFAGKPTTTNDLLSTASVATTQHIETRSPTTMATTSVTFPSVLSSSLTSKAATTSTCLTTTFNTSNSTTSTSRKIIEDINGPMSITFKLANIGEYNRSFSVVEKGSPMPLTVAELDKLNKDTHYSATLFPGYISGKLDIGVSLYVENLRPINDLQMEWEIFVLITWRDERLNDTNGTKFGFVQLNSARDRGKVWTPSIYFPHSTADNPDVLQENRIIYVHSDGMVVFSSRVILTAPCETDLRRYPRNELDCSIYFSNMAQVGEHLDLIWLEPVMVKPLVAERLRPVTFNPEIHPTLLTIGNVSLQANFTFGKDFGDCSSTRPCLTATVHCTKEVGNFVIDTIYPSFVTIIISWVSLFIRKDVISARIDITGDTLLVLQGIIADFNDQSPDSSILSSAQIWLFGLQYHIVALFICFATSIKLNEINLSRRVYPNDETEDFETNEIVELPESSDPIDIYFGISFVLVHMLWWFLLY